MEIGIQVLLLRLRCRRLCNENLQSNYVNLTVYMSNNVLHIIKHNIKLKVFKLYVYLLDLVEQLLIFL